MSMEKEFTNLEQSKWVMEFFEKYPKLKPEELVGHGVFDSFLSGGKDGYYDTLIYANRDGFFDRKHYMTYAPTEYYPAYTLGQLEKILPDEIEYLEYKWQVDKGFAWIGFVRSTRWQYIDMEPLSLMKTDI